MSQIRSTTNRHWHLCTVHRGKAGPLHVDSTKGDSSKGHRDQRDSRGDQISTANTTKFNLDKNLCREVRERSTPLCRATDPIEWRGEKLVQSKNLQQDFLENHGTSRPLQGVSAHLPAEEHTRPRQGNPVGSFPPTTP